MNSNSNNYRLFDDDLQVKNEHVASICKSCRRFGKLCKGRKTYDGIEVEFCPNREKIKK